MLKLEGEIHSISNQELKIYVATMINGDRS